MDREEAQKALELLRTVVKQARDDSALQNWGPIWILHGLTNAAGFIATDVMIVRGVERAWLFALLWLGVVGGNLAAVVLLKARGTGARSFVENQLWSIWMTFIFANAALGVLNSLMGLPLLTLAPVIGILSAVGFSMMGALMGARWYLGSVIFVLTAFAMAVVPRWQFALLGVVWGVAQCAGGVWLTLEKRRHTSDARIV